MPLLADTRSLTTHQKRLREEDATSSTLSDYNSREFNDVTAAREDPYYKIGTPFIKRRRRREDEIFWVYAFNKPPKGLLVRGNSN